MVDYSPKPVPPEQTLVVLNGEPIALEEFDSEFRLMAIHYGAISELEMRATKRRLFDLVVDRHLLMQKALQESLGVTRRELSNDLRDALKDSSADFLGLLKDQGIGEEAWKNKMAQEMLVQKFAERDLYSKAMVSDGDVEEYYWAHLDDFWLSEAIRARHLVVRTARELSQAQVSLKSGESFGKVCSLYSVDPLKDAGGDWGWMPTDSLAPAYIRALKAMKPGEVSKPIKDGFGYHLFQLMETRPARVRSYKEAAPLVRGLLLKREKDRLFVECLTNLKKNAKVEINPDLAAVVGVVLEDSRVIAKKPSKTKKAKNVKKPKKRKPIHRTKRR
jgi:peptidyl-prolyl cis-trans isomerase C